MRTLVTGLDGFTGPYLRSELERYGYTVIGLASDLTDLDDVAAEISQVQPEIVVHLAGISYVGHGNANGFYQVNLLGSRNLLEALGKHMSDVQCVLLASSANIYGNISAERLTEEVTPHPANDYAVSKLSMEQMARLWFDRLPLFIVRPFNYTGVGQDEKFLIPKIIAHFRERKPVIELGNLDVRREFGDVRVVVDTYRRLLECCPVGATLNVCTGETWSLREVITVCEKITGHSIEIRVNPKLVRGNEVDVLGGDNSRLKEMIGNLRTYKLEETLRWMLLKTRMGA
jgi:nucleoside-diphosphate-sugar epimerase